MWPRVAFAAAMPASLVACQNPCLPHFPLYTDVPILIQNEFVDYCTAALPLCLGSYRLLRGEISPQFVLRTETC